MSEIIKLDLHMNNNDAQNLCGVNDRNLQILSEYIKGDVSYRDGYFFVHGNEETAANASRVIASLLPIARKGRMISDQDIIYACSMISQNTEIDFEAFEKIIVGRTLSGRTISPKTKGQYQFAKAMQNNTIVFASGPAGTGKTFLAVIQAVTALKKGEVKRIVLTRPAVEAGESLGFLPGDLKEKVDPYLTPLYDALHIMLGNETCDRMIEKGTIEIAPLAYMRGRTLDDSCVILDEAQNTTISQMKMFLTRLGFHSRMIITGDVTQIDLDRRTESGMVQAVRILHDIDDIAIIQLDSDDVVRHPLVQKIIRRYEEAGKGGR